MLFPVTPARAARTRPPGRAIESRPAPTPQNQHPPAAATRAGSPAEFDGKPEPPPAHRVFEHKIARLEKTFRPVLVKVEKLVRVEEHMTEIDESRMVSHCIGSMGCRAHRSRLSSQETDSLRSLVG